MVPQKEGEPRTKRKRETTETRDTRTDPIRHGIQEGSTHGTKPPGRIKGPSQHPLSLETTPDKRQNPSWN